MISWKLSGSPEYCILTMSESISQAILAALPMFSGVCALVSSNETGIGSIIIGSPASCATEMMFRVRARLSGTDVAPRREDELTHLGAEQHGLAHGVLFIAGSEIEGQHHADPGQRVAILPSQSGSSQHGVRAGDDALVQRWSGILHPGVASAADAMIECQDDRASV